jgi:hypothetical protein
MNRQGLVQDAKANAIDAKAGRLLQRKCTCGNHTIAGGGCTECSKSKNNPHRNDGNRNVSDAPFPLSRIPVMQAKLAVSASDDPLELEADRIADQALAAPANPAFGTAPLRIQRFTAQSSAQADIAPASVDRVLAGSGRSLNPALRQDMERRFGHDFSQVRLHSGSAAEQSARDVNANAYTAGNNIVFGAGRFAPETHDGRRLIAHELAHVVQQSGTKGGQFPQRGRTPGMLASADSLSLPSPSTAALQRQQAKAKALPSDQSEPAPAEHDVAEAGLLAVGYALQSIAAPEAQALRDMYNTGDLRIVAERANLLAKNVAETEIAERLAMMRYELAMDVRKTGSALMRQGAELIDAVRNQARPTYESMRAKGKTDADIIRSATKTNEFVNKLPKGMKWTGQTLWFVSIGLSIYVVVSAPPGQGSAVAQKEIEGTLGGIGGAAAGEAICIAVGIATEGLGLIVCGVLGGIAGSEAARKGNLLQLLDIAPHHAPEMAGRIYRIQGDWKEIDLFILSIPLQTVAASENVLVVATGMVSGQEIGGRGHYRRYEVTPANDAAVKLFGNKDSKYVPQYLLVLATAEDLKKSKD